MAAAKSQSLKNARYEVLIGSKFEGPLDELQLKALWRSEKISADSETRPWGSARSFAPLSRFFDWAVADELRNVKKRSNFARSTRSKFARIAEELAGDAGTRDPEASVSKINVQRRATVDHIPMFNAPFSFDGRIRRLEYGISFILSWIAVIITIITSAAFNSWVVLLALYVPILWFTWAQGCKRCHDRGNSGIFQIIPFYYLWMIFADSEPGANQYGPNPKENK